MKKVYKVRSTGGQTFGPFDPATIEAMAATGRIRPEDELWNSTGRRWVRAGDLADVVIHSREDDSSGDDAWWYQSNTGNEIGPVSLRHLKVMARDGDLTFNSMVRMSGEGWRYAGEVTGLRFGETSSESEDQTGNMEAAALPNNTVETRGDVPFVRQQAAATHRGRLLILIAVMVLTAFVLHFMTCEWRTVDQYASDDILTEGNKDTALDAAATLTAWTIGRGIEKWATEHRALWVVRDEIMGDGFGLYARDGVDKEAALMVGVVIPVVMLVASPILLVVTYRGGNTSNIAAKAAGQLQSSDRELSPQSASPAVHAERRVSDSANHDGSRAHSHIGPYTTQTQGSKCEGFPAHDTSDTDVERPSKAAALVIVVAVALGAALFAWQMGIIDWTLSEVSSEQGEQDATVSRELDETRPARSVDELIRRFDLTDLARWLEDGGDPNATTIDGDSLLRFAVRNDRDDLADLLLRVGAERRPRDGKGDLVSMAVEQLIGGGGRSRFRENPRLVTRLIDTETTVKPRLITIIEARQNRLLDEAERALWKADDAGDLLIADGLVKRAEALGDLAALLKSHVRE